MNEMNKKNDNSNERMRKFRKRMKDHGLVRVEFWVKKDRVEESKQILEKFK